MSQNNIDRSAPQGSLQALQKAAALHADALARARALGYDTVAAALAVTPSCHESSESTLSGSARNAIAQVPHLHEAGRRGGVVATEFGLVVGGPCPTCGQPQALHPGGACPERPPSFLQWPAVFSKT